MGKKFIMELTSGFQLALSGHSSSGKTTIANKFRKANYFVLEMSAELSNFFQFKGVTNPDISTFERFEQSEGSGWLERFAVQKYYKQLKTENSVCISGIRSQNGDFAFKNILPHLILVFLQCPIELRFLRAKNRKVRWVPKTLEEFRQLDKRNQSLGEKQLENIALIRLSTTTSIEQTLLLLDQLLNRIS